MTRVSIITPTYNHAEYLRTSIESLRQQTFEDWELVVVDDGSTDHTAQVVQAAAEEDRRIRYLPQPRRGVRRLAETMNVGLAACEGELVTMLPSDDRWPAYRLERQVPLFEDPRVVLVFGRGRLIDESDRDLGDYPMPDGLGPIVNRPVGSVIGSLLLTNWLPQYTVLIRTATLREIGGYLQPTGLLAEDYPTHLALAERGEFRFVDEVLGFYRMHGHQQTRQHGLEMVRTDREFALRHFAALSPDLQRICGVTEAELRAARHRAMVNAHVQQGRRLLLSAAWADARREFLTAVRANGLSFPSIHVRAIAGLLASVLHRDLEGLARLAGRPRLR